MRITFDTFTSGKLDALTHEFSLHFEFVCKLYDGQLNSCYIFGSGHLNKGRSKISSRAGPMLILFIFSIGYPTFGVITQNVTKCLLFGVCIRIL